MRRAPVLPLLCLFCLPSTLPAQTLGVIKPAGKEPTLTIGGLLQVQADFGDRGDARFTNDNDRFYLRRARLNATGKFLEEFDFRLELDLAGSLSNTSSLRAQLTDGYITWNRRPDANIRVGQFKTPFGFEQLYSDPRLLTLERSLVNDRLTLSRQVGVQVNGDLLEKRLSYAVGAFNGNGVNNNFNDDDRFLLVARGAAVPWQGKLLGASASWSAGGDVFSSDDTNVPQSPEFGFDNNVFSGKRRGYGLDTQLLAGRLEIWAEYLNTRWEPDSSRPASKVESDGWYLQGGWFVVPNRLQVVLKAESFDPRTEHLDDTTEAGTAGLNWYLKGHDLKLMVDYLRVKTDNLPDQDKVLARFQVIF